jgi:glycosyltransferase involved in cell wall biosynthesis
LPKTGKAPLITESIQAMRITMKVAIVHDYLFQYGGAEKCVEVWLDMYPEAEVITSFYIPDKFKSSKQIIQAGQEKRVKTTLAQWIFAFPFMHNFQKHFFWLYPILFSWWTVKDYDLVIISSTFCAKNVRLKHNKKVLYYCYTPTRFLHKQDTELDRSTINPILRFFLPAFNWVLKGADERAVKNLNEKGVYWMGISNYITDKIKEIYNTDSEVVYPPVNLDHFLALEEKPREEFYLYFSRISFHKKTDVAIQACFALGKKLKIAGASGFKPEIEKLKNMVAELEAAEPEKKGLIEFLGRVSDEDRDNLLQTATAMIFPPKEDFGIAPVEAMASGCPVIAYGQGGALEYVTDGLSGTFFKEQNSESLQEAMQRFEKMKLGSVQEMRDSVKKFSTQNFIDKFRELEN